jgi:hypothetical protein
LHEVDDRVLGQFRQDLEGGGIIKKPRAIHRTTCRLWNKVAGSIPSWPQQRVTGPSYRNTYALPWNSFPDSLKADVDDYLEHMAGKDPLADFMPLKPASIDLHPRSSIGGVIRRRSARHGISLPLTS